MGRCAATILMAAMLVPGLFLVLARPAGGTETAPLRVADCAKCHQTQPLMILNNGGSHRTEISCLDCHAEHLPEGTDTIAPCSRCHGGAPHFQLEECLPCHTDPHMPLASLVFPRKPATAACVSCHEQQGREFREYASGHRSQSCTSCHRAHGQIPDCTQCHDPHVTGQIMAECRQCHPAHHPRQITPWVYTPIKFCEPCHREAAENLRRTSARHGYLVCTNCHQGEHPSTPKCQDCHGVPHGPKMHGRFRDCLECHTDPHLLT